MQVDFEVKGKVKAKQSVKFGRNGIKYTPRDIGGVCKSCETVFHK